MENLTELTYTNDRHEAECENSDAVYCICERIIEMKIEANNDALIQEELEADLFIIA